MNSYKKIIVLNEKGRSVEEWIELVKTSSITSDEKVELVEWLESRKPRMVENGDTEDFDFPIDNE